MYVAITGSGKARVVQFREDTRIPGTGKKKTNVIKTLGTYERMLAEDSDIIAKLKKQAKEMAQEKRQPGPRYRYSCRLRILNTPPIWFLLTLLAMS
jgi:hypothetical protein